MSKLIANGLEIEYDVSGPEDGPAVLLIMGLAAQMTFWPAELIENLNAAGFRTIRFDNRDIGMSEKLHSFRTPNIVMQLALRRMGVKGLAPYSLKDMAKDAISVLDALGIKKAHIVGVSMGGIISQVLAASYPERVLSLVPIMSTTNNPSLPRPKSEVAKLLFKPQKPAKTREEAIQRSVLAWSIIGTKDSGASPEETRKKFEIAFDRGYYPAGPKRQLAAIIDTGDVRSFSKKITASTLVIHGRADPLVPMTGGMDIARTIPNAKLELIDGMGHDLPKNRIEKISNLMIKHFKKAGSGKKAEHAA